LRTLIVGFFLVDPLFEDEQPSLERKAELLEMALEGSFGSHEPPSEAAIRQIADHAIRMFTEVAEVASVT
jgi:hypothetical protein